MPRVVLAVGQITVAKLTDKGYKVRALTRSRSKAQDLFGTSQDIDIVECDPRDKASLDSADVYSGCAGAIVCIGTTAFPSARCARLSCVQQHGRASKRVFCLL